MSEDVSSHISITYADLDLNTWSGGILVNHLQINIKNKTDTLTHTRLHVDQLSFDDLSYIDYLWSNQVHFKNIKLSTPKITYFKHKRTPPHTASNQEKTPLATLTNSILVDDFILEDAILHIYDGSKDSVFLKAQHLSLHLKEVTTDPQKVLNKIPIDYASLVMNSGEIFVKTNAYENLNIKNLQVANKKIILEDLNLVPRYSKKELSQAIATERDHLSLHIPKTEIIDYEVLFKNDSLQVTSKNMLITDPDLNVYRDKLVPDDLTEKPLYSKMLRTLPFYLMIDSLQISNARIVYEERVKKQQPAGLIKFNALDAHISHLGNLQDAGVLTQVHCEGIFQENSPIRVDWSFDVHDTSNRFRFSSRLLEMPASDVNSFVSPNLNVAFTGTLDEVYFDIDGDNHSSTINMKMKYDNFNVDVMQSNRLKVDKLLSAIANLFVSKDSKKDGSGYTQGTGKATRKKNASVFNYVWLNIKSGLIATMIK